MSTRPPEAGPPWARALLEPWEALLLADAQAPAVGLPGGEWWTRADLDAAATAQTRILPVPRHPGRSRVLWQADSQAAWLADFLALLRLGWVFAPLDPSLPEAARAQLQEVLRAEASWVRGQWMDHPEAKAVRADTLPPVLLKLSSGSTGLPKAIAVRAEELAADGRAICAGMGIGPADRNFACIPLGHSYGLGNLVAPLLLQGSPVVLGSVPLPQVIAAEIRAGGATVWPAVPPLLAALARADLPPEALDPVRLVISAGAPLAPEVARAFCERTRRAVHNFYGASETGGIAYDATGTAAELDGAVGQPLPGVRLSCNRQGRLRVAGPAVHGSGSRLLADRAQARADGSWRLLGRTDRVVKYAGRRLDLAALEQAILGIPGVREVFVCRLMQPRELLAVAYVGEAEVGTLQAALASRVADWQRPRRWLRLEAFPLTPRGKQNRALLEARLLK